MSAICRVNQLLLLLLSQGNKRSYILKNRETINGSVNFKLPELNYDINMRRATDTHRYESVKARGNKNPDAKETLTKEMVYSGTMGRIKRNMKKHFAFLEKQKEYHPTVSNSSILHQFKENLDKKLQEEGKKSPTVKPQIEHK